MTSVLKVSSHVLCENLTISESRVEARRPVERLCSLQVRSDGGVGPEPCRGGGEKCFHSGH